MAFEGLESGLRRGGDVLEINGELSIGTQEVE